MIVEIKSIEFYLDDLWEEGWRFDSVDQSPNLYFFLPKHLKKKDLITYMEDNIESVEASVGTSFKINHN